MKPGMPTATLLESGIPNLTINYSTKSSIIMNDEISLPQTVAKWKLYVPDESPENEIAVLVV